MTSRTLLLLAVLLVGSSAWVDTRAVAHEIGTSRVTVQFDRRDRYSIEVVTDAPALLAKLEAAAGQPTNNARDAASLARRFEALDAIFRGRLRVAFDNALVQPAASYAVAARADGASSPVATIRLSGAVPDGARHFTWQYGWTFASYALTIRHAGSSAAARDWLEGDAASAPFPLVDTTPPPGRVAVARRHFVLGFTHIVPEGLDHVLFVLGLFLLSVRARSILLQVSAFTVAHSITLGLSMYGVISAPSSVVEPMIALSIAYVAIENLFLAELKAWRLLLVFAFGLLHGMGFAGALQELGLPRSEFLTALLTFNLGVEGGQLAVIGAAALLVGWQSDGHRSYRRRIVIPASAVIACIAVYWTVERLIR